MEPANSPSRRAPVTLKIKFKSGSVDEFVQRYAGDISHGGIFIRTKTPLTVGTALRFEFQLRDASSLMGGDGTVVWIRESDPNRPTAVSGMGVRFDRLNDGSQLVLDRVLAHKGRPSQVLSSPPVSFDDATKENTAQTQAHTVGRYAATIADDLDDDRTIQRAAAPTGQHDAIDDFAEHPGDSTKVRAVSELQRQLEDRDVGRATAAAEVLSEATRPGIGMVGDRTAALTVSDLMDASFDERGAEEPTVAMAAPVFPSEPAATPPDAQTVAVPRASTASILAAQHLGSSAALPKRRGTFYAVVAISALAAAAAAYVYFTSGFSLDLDGTTAGQGSPEQPTVAAAPPQPPTPQPIEPAPPAVAVDPAAATAVAPTLLETTISANAPGAIVTLIAPPASVGAQVSGVAPFALQVPPDIELTATVSAPGFRDASVRVKAGQAVVASLVAVPARPTPAPRRRPAVSSKPIAPTPTPAVAPVTEAVPPSAATPATDPATTPAPVTTPTPGPVTTPTPGPVTTPTPAPITTLTPAPPPSAPVTTPTPAPTAPPAPAPTTKDQKPTWINP